MLLTFYVTPLDSTCSVVLGYSWLTCYNPGIDWVLRHITFRTTLQGEPSLMSTDSPVCMAAASASPSLLKLSVSLISTAAFLRASKLGGSQIFCIQLSDSSTSASAHKATLDKRPPDLSAVPPKYHNFADVFSESQANILAPHHPYNLKIHLDEGTASSWGPIYSLSQVELCALCDFIDKNVKTGFICPSYSLHEAPILFIRKKDSFLQLYINYRGLNKISQKNKYPLPLLTDLLDAPWKAQIYTKIDLRHAYYLVRIADGDEWKTTFCIRYSSFEWLVMPFGLTNAPAAFQQFINNVFSDLVDVCIVIYLDNILIYSADEADHTQQVREVLCRLHKNGLYARADKCEFHSDTVEYLGYVLSPEGLTMSSNKVCTIMD